MFTTTAERTEIRNKLSALFKSVAVGGTVTHEQLIAGTGMSLERLRPLIKSVRDRLVKDSGLVFVPVYGTGYQLISTAGLSDVAKSARRSITRKARKTQAAIVNALGKTNDVDDSTRKRLHTEIGALGLIELAAGERSFKRMQDQLDDEMMLNRPPTPDEISTSLIDTLRKAR